VKLISGKVMDQAMRYVLLLGFCFVLTGTSAAQNQYYVSSSGSDSNEGSQARPWKSIQHADAALSVSSGGAVVHVAPGSYSGPITTQKAGTASGRVVYISDSKWGAKITNANWQINGPYTDVNGFDLTSTTGWCTGISHNASPLPHDIHIIGNYCHDVSVGTQCVIGGAMWEGGTQPTSSTNPPPTTNNWYVGNVIRHIGNPSGNTAGATCHLMSGIYSHGGHELFYNNVISGAAGWGMTFDGPTGVGLGTVVSGNTVFNNGGGIDLNQCGDNACGVADFWTINNNIVVNNGVGTVSPSNPVFGISFDHVSGTHNVVSNNLVYGNLPSNYSTSYKSCTVGMTQGCPPVTNAKSDASTDVTFANFQSDTNQSPTSNYSPDNYKLKAGSSAIQNGTTQCASSPGQSPCIPTTDFDGTPRSASLLDIGAHAIGSASGDLPSAPTGLTAQVQ
jgi:Protein of unknown function (DUF1565)